MAPRLIALAALGLIAVGCVPQSKYDALRVEHEQTLEQLNQAQNEATAAKSMYDALKRQFDALVAKGGDSSKLLEQYLAENGELQKQIGEWQRKYQDAMENQVQIGQGSPLPAQVTSALKELADQFPDVMEFDAARGIIRLKSDVTFAKGSADLNPQAKTVIGRLAQILNMPQVGNLELLVAGHTDNSPVVQTATIRAGHKDNWYLSSHRAITVGTELMKHNVATARIGMLGYADQHPIAPNTTTEGKARNRRVEVLVLPTTYKNSTVARSVPAAAPSRRTVPVAPKRAPIMDKDAAITAPDTFVK